MTTETKLTQEQKVNLRKKVVLEELAYWLEEMTATVGAMVNMYEQNDWLNDEVDISQVVPMSLDEWQIALAAKIGELGQKWQHPTL